MSPANDDAGCPLEGSRGGRSIAASAAVIAVFTALCRVLGLAREILMAVFFGTSLAKSAFDVAFQIPNVLRYLLGEGALSAAFIPVYSETLEREGPQAAHRLAGRIFGLLLVVLAAVSAAGVGLMAWLSTAAVWPRVAAIAQLGRIMFPYVFFVCVSAFGMAVLNAHRMFALAAAMPAVLNIVVMAVLAGLCPLAGGLWERISLVAWGVVAAGAIQVLLLAGALKRAGVTAEVGAGWRDEKARRIVRLMAPVAMGFGVYQVSVLTDNVFAVVAAPWAPAALTYAQRIVYLPLSLFGTAMGTVLLPTFSEDAARRDIESLRSTLHAALRHLAVVIAPAAIFIMALGPELVRAIFSWKGGRFDETSAVWTTRALMAYAPGLFAFAAQKSLAAAFYALQKPRTLVKVSAASLGLNAALNVLFLATLPEGYRHVGVAAATTVSSFVCVIVLARILRKHTGSAGWPAIGWVTLRSVCASAAGAAAAKAVLAGMGMATAGGGGAAKWAEAAWLALAAAVGAAVWFGAALILLGGDVRRLADPVLRRWSARR